MNRANRKKINKDIVKLNTINQWDLINTDRLFHPKQNIQNTHSSQTYIVRVKTQEVYQDFLRSLPPETIYKNG